MTELPLEGGSINAKHPRDLCTALLWKHLTETPAAQNPANLIAWGNELRAEAKRIREPFQAFFAPMGSDALIGRLIEVAPGYGLTDLEADEYRAIFGPYVMALGHLPLPALDDALTRWNNGEGMKKGGENAKYIMPRPDQLLGLSERCMKELTTAAWRFRKALEQIDRMPPPKFTRPTRSELIAQGILDNEGRVILKKPEAQEPIPEAF